MVTVKEFIEWLKKFPEDTEVEMAIQQEAEGYNPHGDIYFESPELNGKNCGLGWEFCDFKNDENIEKENPLFGRTILELGERS